MFFVKNHKKKCCAHLQNRAIYQKSCPGNKSEVRTRSSSTHVDGGVSAGKWHLHDKMLKTSKQDQSFSLASGLCLQTFTDIHTYKHTQNHKILIKCDWFFNTRKSIVDRINTCNILLIFSWCDIFFYHVWTKDSICAFASLSDYWLKWRVNMKTNFHILKCQHQGNRQGCTNTHTHSS